MKKFFTLLILILCAALSVPLNAATTTYNFSSSSWAASPANWTSGKNGAGYSNNGVQVTQNATGANATSPVSFTNVSSVVVTYCTNSSKGAGTVEVQVGSNTAKSQSVTKTGGTTARTLTYSFSPTETGKVKITVNCTTNSIYIISAAITTEDAPSGDPPAAPTISSEDVSNGGSTTTAPTISINFPTGSEHVYYNVGTTSSVADPTASSHTGDLTAAGNVSYSFAAGNTYYIKAVASNSYGVSSSATFSFTYNTPPLPGTVSFSPAAINGTTVTSAPTITLSASDADTYYWTIGQGSAPADPTASVYDGSGATIAASNFTTSGTYYIKAIAHNSQGNSAVANFSFTYNKPVNAWLYGDTKTLWKEFWDGLSAGSSSNQNAPSTCSITGASAITYTWGTSGTQNHYINTSPLAGGASSPELLFRGDWTVTIPVPASLTLPANLVLTYRSNNTNATVSSSTSGVTVGSQSREPASGAGLVTYPITVAAGVDEIVLVFSSTSGNTRLDDLVLEVDIDQVETPTFSPDPANTYTSAQSVTISCATSGATIYYTTDGSTPTTSSTQYTGAITVSATTTIKAFAVYSGMADSEVATATYTISATPAPTGLTISGVTNGASVSTAPALTLSATNATAYYWTIGEDTTPADPTSTSGEYDGSGTTIAASNFNAGHTYTVKAIAYNSTVPCSVVAITFTVTSPISGDTYELLTSTSELDAAITAGKKVIIAGISSNTPYVMGSYNNNKYDPATGTYSYDSSEKTITITTSGTEILWEVSKSGSSYVFKDGSNYLNMTAGNGSSTNITHPTTSQELTVSIASGGDATIYYGTAGTRSLRYHTSNVKFGNYTSSGTVIVGIYAEAAEATKCRAITFDPASGTNFVGQLTVTPTSTEGSTITYTITNNSTNATVTSGSVASGSSFTYNAPAGSEGTTYTVSATATKTGLDPSDAATATYTCVAPANVTASPAAGTIYTTTSVELSCATDGATIYYTIDGSTPTTSSSVYSSAISVSGTTTIKAFAVKNGMVSSVQEFEYEFEVGQPTFSPNGGTHDQSVTVTISTASTGATIYYTTDGSEPTTSSSVYSEPLTFTRTTTLKAIAVLNGVSSEMRVATFTVNKASGVTTLWSEAFDGCSSGTGPASCTGTGTATYAYVNGGSDTKIYAESVAGGTSPELLIGKSGGSMTATITLPAGTSGDLTLRFLENGDRISVTSSTTDVTVGTLSYNSSSKQAEVTISLASATTELVLEFSNTNSSNVRVDNFMLTKVTPAVPDPVISPEGGTYDNVQTVTITCDDEDATIYYTTNGNTPDDGSTEYTGAITVSNSPTTIKAIAYDKDRIYFSDVAEATYTLKAGTPNPTAVETQEINASLSYKAQSTTEGSTIWYTLDGTDPVVNGSNSSSVANGGFITIDHTCTLKMMAVKTGFVNSEIKTIAWTYIPVLSPQFTLAPGTYTDAQGTYIMEDTDDATVYYTISYDGTEPADPTNASTLYAVNTRIELPIDTTIIKAIAYNGLGEYSNVTRAQYICNQGNYELRITPSSGSYVSAVDVSILEEHKVGSSLIYYTLDGTDPSSSGTAVEYDGTPITISSSCTLRVYGIDEHAVAAEGTYTSSATYRIGVQAPEFSPLSGSTLEYKGDQDIQIFSTTLNAKIYYIISNSAEPADPTKTTGTLYTGSNSDLKDLSVGTYYIKAIAYVGDEASAVSSGEFHVSTESTGLLNVAALNNYGHAESSSYIPFQNPIQIVFMDRYLNGYDSNPANDTLQYAYVRDNSGYGIIYFGNPRKGYGAGKTHFEMGDWIDGTQVSGHISNWSSGLPGRYQMGESSGGINSWPTSTIGHTDILPEEVTIAEINSGDEGTDNLWAHYVHVKNTDVRVFNKKNSERWQGIVKEVLTGDSCVYYDSFYLHDDKDASYWSSQPVHRTFDIAGVVVYYSGLSGYASNFELAPIAFEYTDMPQITPAGGHKAGPLNVTIDFYSDVPNADKDGVSFYYKTSTMDDYALYTGPFTVRSTTTVEAYSVRISEITGEELRSLVVSEEYIFDQVERPVISPESKVFTKNEPVSVTITCETPSAIIWYTTDGTDPLSASGTRQRYIPGETVITITESTTVRAIATKGTVSSTEAESRTYTLVKDNGIKYVLVKNVGDLADGSTYVIVNQLYSVAMSNNQKTANRDAVAVTLSGASNDTVHVNEDVARFTLTASGGGWNLYTEDGESTAHGYLSAGVASQNQLLTSATASDETLATIAIDPTDYHATVTFTDKGGSTRYLRYFRNSNLYNLYTSETSNTRPVFIYKREVTDLADIVKNGKIGNQYTVADDIVGVFVPANDPDALYAKDLNKSRFRQYNDKGAKDYLHDVMGIETAALDYDQSTWVRITGLEHPDDFEGKIIPGGTLAGHLRNKINPEFEYDSGTTPPTPGDASSYTHQTYTPANFMGEYLTGNHNIEYFFVVPKPQEYVKVVGAVYAGENQFFVPEPDDETNENLAGLEGGFSVDWSILNAEGSVPTGISTGESYEMEGIAYALSSGGSGSGIRRRTSSASNSLKLKPTSIEITDPVTGVDGVDVARKVVGVRYYNMNGMQNDRPFENSINVMVITYDDGSTVSRKIAF